MSVGHPYRIGHVVACAYVFCGEWRSPFGAKMRIYRTMEDSLSIHRVRVFFLSQHGLFIVQHRIMVLYSSGVDLRSMSGTLELTAVATGGWIPMATLLGSGTLLLRTQRMAADCNVHV